MTYILKTSVCSLVIGLFAPTNLQGQASSSLTVTPSPRQEQQPEARNDYQQCRKRALHRSKRLEGERKSRFLRMAIAQCREQFPAIAVLQDCKRKAFQAYRNHRKYLRAALNQCRTQYEEFNFNPSVQLPIKTYKNDVYFAGVGLNLPVPVHQLTRTDQSTTERRIGNFNCQPLVKTYARRKAAEHILFSNDMHSYRPLQNVSSNRLRQALVSSSQREQDAWVHPEWGHILAPTGHAKLPHYFPSSHCHFDRELGAIYQDIKIYYLLDRDRKAIIPYFGVAFYTLEAEIRPSDLLEGLRAELGDDYQVQRTNGRFEIIAAHPIAEVDADGDPFNLCRHPRPHQKIAVIARHENSEFAFYFLLSNPDNLCKHGDQIASRFLKQGL